MNYQNTTRIPVIGTAVVNKDTYWVSRLIMSVDHPVEEFVIINNNGTGVIDEDLNNLAKIKNKFINKIKVCHMPYNIGCGGSWNLIIKCYMLARYWIIVNDDVAFGPGFLKEMQEKAEADPEVGMIHGYQGDHGVGSWDLFLIRDHVIQQYGLFDENLYPAYCEDADYHMKFMIRPIRKIMNLDANYYHGHGNKDEYHIHGRQTQKSDASLEKKLVMSNDVNIEYLTKKWGPGWRTCCPEHTAFGGKPWPYNANYFDLEFVRSKHLGF
jgi:hypothetical protein